MMQFRDFLYRCRDFLFTPLCTVCRAKTDAAVALCPDCLARYREALLWECGQCGKMLSACLCSNDVLRAARVKRMIKLFRYRPEYPELTENRMLYRMKHDNPEPLFRFAAEELARPFLFLCRPDEDWVITHLPRTVSKEKLYGYDQARRLAEELSRASGIPFVKTLRRSRKHSLEQKQMKTREERIENARDSYLFIAGTAIAGKKVLLVDDIVTTGASIASAATLLRKEGGAAEVVAAALAIVSHNKNPLYLYAEKRKGI